MWVFFNDAFLSIVSPAPNDHTPYLLVRARLPGDIERVFPAAQVMEDTGSDYRFRAMVDRGAVALVIKNELEDIDYENFKDSVQDHNRHHTYLRIWQIMFRAQQNARKP